jgi:uncharacterized membrane-anchored protein
LLRQWLVSVAVSLCNISIHALVMAAVVRVALAVNARRTWHPWLQLIAVMSAAVSCSVVLSEKFIQARFACSDRIGS